MVGARLITVTLHHGPVRDTLHPQLAEIGEGRLQKVANLLGATELLKVFNLCTILPQLFGRNSEMLAGHQITTTTNKQICLANKKSTWDFKIYVTMIMSPSLATTDYGSLNKYIQTKN